jgi:hypothetical protein
LEDDLMNLRKYTVYLKQLIDGMPSLVFSAGTFPPYKKNERIFAKRYEKILGVSREKYSKSKDSVEERIRKTMDTIEKQEDVWEKKKEDFKNKKQEEKRKVHEEKMKKQASASTLSQEKKK